MSATHSAGSRHSDASSLAAADDPATRREAQNEQLHVLLEAAKVRTESGAVLQTADGAAVTSHENREQLKEAARDAFVERAMLPDAVLDAENREMLGRTADQVVDTALGPPPAMEADAKAFEGLQAGLASASLSVLLDDTSAVHDSLGPALLEKGSFAEVAQVLALVADAHERVQGEAFTSVEGLRPALDAFREMPAPSMDQAQVLASVSALDAMAVNAISLDAKQPGALNDFAQDVDKLADAARSAFGQDGEQLSTRLHAFADALRDPTDIEGASRACEAALTAGDDLARQTLREFTQADLSGSLDVAQQRLDEFAPAALQAFEPFATALEQQAGATATNGDQQLGVTLAGVAMAAQTVQRENPGIDNPEMAALIELAPLAMQGFDGLAARATGRHGPENSGSELDGTVFGDAEGPGSPGTVHSAPGASPSDAGSAQAPARSIEQSGRETDDAQTGETAHEQREQAGTAQTHSQAESADQPDKSADRESGQEAGQEAGQEMEMAL